MHLKIVKEPLITMLVQLMGVIERKSTLAILSNVKLNVSTEMLTMVGSDKEVELVSQVALEAGACLVAGEITLPARKLLEICKLLPNGAMLDVQVKEAEQRCVLKSGKSRFVLGTLPAKDYPTLSDKVIKGEQIQLQQKAFKQLFDATSFAMAVQDVRFYLTGTLLELEQQQLRAISTDGHRLAFAETQIIPVIDEKTTEASLPTKPAIQTILPRKAVAELVRLLNVDETLLTLTLGRDLFSVATTLAGKEKHPDIQICFTSKLIDGKFPDYRRVIPRVGDRIAVLSSAEFRRSLQRVSILSNEKLRGISLNFENNNVRLQAFNQEQDEAIEDLAINFQGEATELTFNVQYLLDILAVINADDVQISMMESAQSVRIQVPDQNQQIYVVMPMRL